MISRNEAAHFLCTCFNSQFYLKPMNHNSTLKWKLDIPLNVISMFTRWWNDKRLNTLFCDRHIYRLSHKIYSFYSNSIGYIVTWFLIFMSFQKFRKIPQIYYTSQNGLLFHIENKLIIFFNHVKFNVWNWIHLH